MEDTVVQTVVHVFLQLLWVRMVNASVHKIKLCITISALTVHILEFSTMVQVHVSTTVDKMQNTYSVEKNVCVCRVLELETMENVKNVKANITFSKDIVYHVQMVKYTTLNQRNVYAQKEP